MDVIFNERIIKLPIQLEELNSCRAITRMNLKNVPLRGVYLFLEDGKPIYIGRTNRMRARLLEHGRGRAGHNDASFAFKLAREKAKECGVYTNQKRLELCADLEFNRIFSECRQRVAKMDIKYIEISDPIDQCLFEVYASVVLKTPYNDFENH